MIKSLVTVLIFLILGSNVRSQDVQVYSPDYSGKFDELLKNPQQFTSLEKTEIYLAEVSKYLSSSMDTARIGYENMIKFGKSIPDDFVTGIGYHTLAFTYQMRGDIESSIIYKKFALTYLKNHKQRLKETMHALGIAYISINELDSAAVYTFRALQMNQELKDTSAFTSIYTSVAQLYKAQRRFSSAIENYQKALEFISFSPSKLNGVSIHNKLGRLYIKLNDIPNAKFHFKASLEIAKSQNYNNSIRVISYHLGQLEWHEKNYGNACDIFNDLYNTIDNSVSNIYDFKLFACKMKCAIHFNDPVSVEKYFKLLQNIYSQENINVEYLYYRHLSDYHFYNKEYNKAITYSKKLLESKEVTHHEQAYENLSKIHKQQNKWREAFAMQDSTLELRKRNNTLSQQNLIYDYESKYQKALQDQEIITLNNRQEIQELKLSKQNGWLIFSLIGLILAGLAFLGIMYAYRTKTKSNALLRDKNKKLGEALDNNKILLKEIHHRVKNNLQVISSLLSLQSRYVTDQNASIALNEGQNRVESMALIHQNLYRDDNISGVNMRNYIPLLADNIFNSYNLKGDRIKIEYVIDDLTLDVSTVIPIGLVLNELISNALKYAFPDDMEGILKVSLFYKSNNLLLSVADNGIGMVSKPAKSGFGTKLINSFTRKLEGELEIKNEKGTAVEIQIKNYKIA